jgi:hypothetical protein
MVAMFARALHHAPRPTAGAKSASLATEGQQLLGTTVAAVDSRESILQATALQIALEPAPHVSRQSAAAARQVIHKIRIIPPDESVRANRGFDAAKLPVTEVRFGSRVA